MLEPVAFLSFSTLEPPLRDPTTDLLGVVMVDCKDMVNLKADMVEGMAVAMDLKEDMVEAMHLALLRDLVDPESIDRSTRRSIVVITNFVCVLLLGMVQSLRGFGPSPIDSPALCSALA